MDELRRPNNSDDQYNIIDETDSSPLVEEADKGENVDQEAVQHISDSLEYMPEEDNFLLEGSSDDSDEISSDISEIFSRLVEEDSDSNFWIDDNSEVVNEVDIDEDPSILNLEAVPVDVENSLISDSSDTRDSEMIDLIATEDWPSFAADSEASNSIFSEHSQRESDVDETFVECGSSKTINQITKHVQEPPTKLTHCVREQTDKHTSVSANVLFDKATEISEQHRYVQIPQDKIGVDPSERYRSCSDVQVATCSNVTPSSLSYKRKAADYQEIISDEEDSSDDDLQLQPSTLLRDHKRRRVNNDDMFVKMLTPCDELKFMARDLHFKWISIEEAGRSMKEIFSKARTELEFWRKRNVDCSHAALMKTCSEESILQLVYSLMSEPVEVLDRMENSEAVVDVGEWSIGPRADNEQRSYLITNDSKTSTSEKNTFDRTIDE